MNFETQFPSSSGGVITIVVDKKGNRTGLIHSAGKAYSGKLAQIEGQEARKAKKSKRA